MRIRALHVNVVVAATLCAALLTLPAMAAGSGSPRAAGGGPLLPSSDPFYTYSGSLAGIAPGTILKQRPVTLTGMQASSATQVLYRTSGERGQPTVTVATIIRPLLGALGGAAGTTKLVSYQTAYDALGPKCDPSYAFQGGDPQDNGTNTAEQKVVQAYVTAGDTVVVPDYEGVNLDWTAGQESGYGTLDGIRATENLLKLSPSSTPVGMVGYSGGSIATEFAAEVAPTYASELNIVGTAAGGVPVEYLHNLPYINGTPDWSGIMPAVLVALGRAFNVSITPYLSPYGVKLAGAVQGQCINSFEGAYPGLTYQKLLKPQYQDIYKLRPIVEISNRLIMSRTGTPRGPLFLAVGNKDGTGDGVMIAADVEGLAHTYCQRGVSVQFDEYKGDAHTEAAIPFEAKALAFLTQRLNGLPVVNGCSSIGPGNSLTPFSVPAALTGSGSGSHHRFPYLRLRVSPSRVRAGHAVRYRFTVFAVANGHMRRLRGARIRFAGHIRHTDTKGQASITKRLRIPGHDSARATHRRYRAATTRVRVLPGPPRRRAASPRFTG